MLVWHFYVVTTRGKDQKTKNALLFTFLSKIAKIGCKYLVANKMTGIIHILHDITDIFKTHKRQVCACGFALHSILRHRADHNEPHRRGRRCRPCAVPRKYYKGLGFEPLIHPRRVQRGADALHFGAAIPS